MGLGEFGVQGRKLALVRSDAVWLACAQLVDMLEVTIVQYDRWLVGGNNLWSLRTLPIILLRRVSNRVETKELMGRQLGAYLVLLSAVSQAGFPQAVCDSQPSVLVCIHLRNIIILALKRLPSCIFPLSWNDADGSGGLDDYTELILCEVFSLLNR